MPFEREKKDDVVGIYPKESAKLSARANRPGHTGKRQKRERDS